MAVAVRKNLSELYPATPDAVTAARGRISEFAAAAGATPSTVEAVRLAVSEAMTNVAVHAYPGGSGDAHVTAAVAGDELWVLVADNGCGHQTPTTSSGLGWGLALIAQAADDFLITERSGGGTEVRMRFPLPARTGSSLRQRAAEPA